MISTVGGAMICAALPMDHQTVSVARHGLVASQSRQRGAAAAANVLWVRSVADAARTEHERSKEAEAHSFPGLCRRPWRIADTRRHVISIRSTTSIKPLPGMGRESIKGLSQQRTILALRVPLLLKHHRH